MGDKKGLCTMGAGFSGNCARVGFVMQVGLGTRVHSSIMWFPVYPTAQHLPCHAMPCCAAPCCVFMLLQGC